MNKKSPVNTAKEAEERPESFLFEAFARQSVSDTIEAQEERGNRSFIESDTLPTEMDASAKNILESFGIKFLGPVEGDELFQFVELPAGWKKEQVNHYWSGLIDNNGRSRASIFYKAAFYDRRARLSLNCRFSVTSDYEKACEENIEIAIVKDGEVEIFRTEPMPLPSGKGSWKERAEISEKARNEASAWLDNKYPDWRSFTAYWD